MHKTKKNILTNSPVLDSMSEKELWEWGKDDKFFQFYNNRVKNFIDLNNENKHAANMYMFFSSRMNRNTNAVACSYRFLQDFFEISRTSAYRAVKILRDRGFLQVYASGSLNVFVMYGEVVWKSDEVNRHKQIAKIPTTVFISKDEQANREDC